MTGATNLDFVERSLASRLYPAAATAYRSPGAVIRGNLSGGVVQYWIGAFNGKGILTNKILLSFLLTTLFVLANGCGGVANCPVCGTTKNDGYAIIDIIPVPEHNPTGAPGGPFNSFDISWVDPVNHLDYVSDRIGIDVAVFDTINNVAVNIITGANGVAGGGFLLAAALAQTSFLLWFLSWATSLGLGAEP